MRTLYVLGAGFSAPFGLPLAKDLMEVVHARLGDSEHWRRLSLYVEWYLDPEHQTFERLLLVLADLKAMERARDIERVEQFFRTRLTALAQAAYADSAVVLEQLRHILEGRHDSRGVDTADELYDLAVRALATDLWAKCYSKEIPDVYISFANQLSEKDIIITFDYDNIVERTLTQTGVPAAYRLWHDGISILKLHGSLDVLKSVARD